MLLGNLQASFHVSLINLCWQGNGYIACHYLMQFSILVIAGWKKLIWIWLLLMPPWKLYNNLKLDSTTVVWKYSFGCSFVYYKKFSITCNCRMETAQFLPNCRLTACLNESTREILARYHDHQNCKILMKKITTVAVFPPVTMTRVKEL